MKKLILVTALCAPLVIGGSGVAAPAARTKSSIHAPAVPVLVDGAGKIAGRFIAGGFFGAALLDYKNKSLVVRLAANPDPSEGGLTWESGFLYYASKTCTGKAYLYSVAPTGSRNPIQVMKEGSRFVAYIGSNEVQQPPPNLLSGRNGGTGTCYEGKYTQGVVTPVESTFNLDLLGTPPFYIQ